MTYSVIPTPTFRKQAKRLVKKYLSLKKELEQLEKQLSANPVIGTNLGNNTYKLRLAVKSKGGGKSGGMRLITYVVTKQLEVFLLTIYDKAEQESVDNKTLKSIIQSIAKK
jgi:mRNA-degrading endonuclease RelE of RelBE toxin-antitoxin system